MNILYTSKVTNQEEKTLQERINNIGKKYRTSEKWNNI